jgi:hypothetical protein
MKISQMLLGLLLGSSVTVAAWSVTAADVDKLGKELLPTGGERAGNKDGTIPAFEGENKPLSGWTWGKLREDYYSHKDEKPVFEINASNVDKYADKLSEGQIAMLKQLNGYTLPVYPSHRNCTVPEFVEKNTKETALKSAISKKDGWSLETAILPSVPFPFASSGIEMVWNWLTRYQGVGMEWTRGGWTLLSPRPGSNSPIYGEYMQIMYYPWANTGQHTPQEYSGLDTAWYYAYMTPASLAGQALVQRYYFSQPTDSFYYFTGQRRVRRLPAYAYDAPLIGWENQYPADTSFGFIGNPDRFEWKIVGKKEMYIPYNDYRVQRFNYQIKDAMQAQYVNPELRRYELHRVWQVEGTLKAGVRHATPKKVLYIDEDSWLIGIVDEWDGQGKLWRSKENFSAVQWEIGACAVNAETYNDLIGGRYIFDQSVIQTGGDLKWYPPGTRDPRLTDAYYTSENLGAISER